MILSMSQKERTRLHVAHCLIEGKMQISEAALVLGLLAGQAILSERQKRNFS
jgi:hypothetical protein